MFCQNCGKQVNEGSAFCPVCGTPVADAGSGFAYNANPNNVPPVNQGHNYNTSQNGYYGNVIYSQQLPKQPNPKIESFKNNLKLFLKNPGQAIENELADKNIFTALISGGILLASFAIMFLCLAGKADSEFGIDNFYGLGIIAAILCSAFFMAVPSATAFISSKTNGLQLNFVGALSANGLKTFYISAFLILSGFSVMISIKLFAFMLLLTGMMNTFLSVSYINRASGNTLSSSKSLWVTYGVYALFKIIATVIIYEILSSVIKEMLEEIIQDLLFGSVESLF